MKQRERSTSFIKKRGGQGILALLAACLLVLFTTTSTLAASVNIEDRAGILQDRGRIQNAAQSLEYPVTIYTMSGFNGDQRAFEQKTKASVKSKNQIVMAITLRLGSGGGRVAISGGSDVKLNGSDYSAAAKAFTDKKQSGGSFSDAAAAALESLSSASSGGPLGSISRGGGFGTWCCIGLLVLLGLGIFGIIRSRKNRPGGGFGGFGNLFNRGPRPTPPPPYGEQPYNQYGQPYPPNYGPNYGPDYDRRRGGMNPWAAGGLGAAAGGLLGYELGRHAGENQAHNNDGGFGEDVGSSGFDSDYGGDSGFGGDVGSSGFDSDFGGGDFGGGDFGGGGDSGSSGF
ncbi:hypothetical protein EI42_05357 [Thermosporothrix hazakensis]|jgi:hypothetical protein|uniref:Membrane protein YgcG n=1 Tax=Thermosporothrix hazakensis TaxID=644383 RepID=A0A326U8D0_THEHA|nr:hypothetical protein [Thermosporothrix hazakensis]PZW22572.1 hypothetical protein EI42_05357 [Thermosporothrix hazakensis]GCE48544.1 hypothetical protein KTH_34130 [Thermosporothrix hazakensis]